MIEVNQCIACEWNYNGICCCEGVKPCYVIKPLDKNGNAIIYSDHTELTKTYVYDKNDLPIV